MRIKDEITPGKNGAEIVTVGYAGMAVVYPSHVMSELAKHTKWQLTGQAIDLAKNEVTYTWTAVD